MIHEETNMTEHTIEGNWQQLKGKVREQWGKLKNDELDVIAGKREVLVGKIREMYGKTIDEVEREVTDFESRHLKAD
jgi:uncharacterized protein YjbJ (UPF0337 family)